MARKKVKLEFIENATKRRVTYKKRVKGLMKKAEELSVLCEVDTAVVVYSPYQSTPVVWPTPEVESKNILIEYLSLPRMEQTERQFNQERFLKESVAKAKEKLDRLISRNRELEMENLLIDLLEGNKPIEQVALNDLKDVLWVVDDRIRAIRHRLGVLERGNNASVSANGGVNNAMGGLNNAMRERPPWEMEAGPSQVFQEEGRP